MGLKYFASQCQHTCMTMFNVFFQIGLTEYQLCQGNLIACGGSNPVIAFVCLFL